MGFLADGLEDSSELAHSIPGIPLWLYIVLPIAAVVIGLPLWNAIAPPDIKEDIQEMKYSHRQEYLELKALKRKRRELLRLQKREYKRRKKSFRRQEGDHRWSPLHRRRNLKND